ncbi:MAG: ABC transporter ATP-binding protein [Pseudomonadota bacterium]|nr:ABC transporter ATP-binding protein [Pseudomonadota bacterium]
MTGVLRTDTLTKRFAGLAAVDGVTLKVPPGARHAIIGPNGAGKTTLINLLCGSIRPTAGDIFLGDERITALAQHQRAKRGLTRTHQVTSLFPGLTVLESVLLAVLERKGLAARFMRPAMEFREEVEEARAILASLALESEAGRRTAELAYGRQRLLEIALGLATRASILLLDEPAAGIPAAQSVEVFGVIARLPADVTVIFIEHDMGLVFRFAERITVLVAGRILMEGTPDEVAADARVRAVYLGEEVHG